MSKVVPNKVATSAALILLGCGSGYDLAPMPNPPDGFAYAYATPSCAPWDGRAVEILLTAAPAVDPENARPLLRLVIYPRERDLARKSYRWPADPEMATGARCTADACDFAESGEISLRAVRADSAVEGTVTLRFQSNEVLSGGFRAEWRSRQVFCG